MKAEQTMRLPATTPAALLALAVGDECAGVTVGPIGRTDIVRYAGAGGDFNPMHHDDEFARAAGMPSVFAMGLMTTGLLSRVVARWLGVANVVSFSTRFTDKVWPGDVLTVTGAVTGISPGDDGAIAECEFSVRRANGEEVLTGLAHARCTRSAGRAVPVAPAADPDRPA